MRTLWHLEQTVKSTSTCAFQVPANPNQINGGLAAKTETRANIREFRDDVKVE